MKIPKEIREKEQYGAHLASKERCSVRECDKKAIRSLSEYQWQTYFDSVGLPFLKNKRKKIFVCKVHYNKVSKEKKEREKPNKKKGFLEKPHHVQRNFNYKNNKKQKWI